jgi:PAS domain S-box-containing protein
LATLAEFIELNRNVIGERFVEAVRSLAPAGSSRVVIVDHIPQFLDALVETLRTTPAGRSSLPAMREPARVHGLQRLAHGFELDVVVREYGALRHVILELVADADIAVDARTFDVFAQAISSGVLAAVTQHIEEQNRHTELERRRLRTILAILPVGVFVSDARGGILEVNAAGRAVWGIRPDASVGNGEFVYRGHYPRGGGEVLAEDWPATRALYGETVHDFEVEIETFDNGEKKTLVISSAPIHDEDGTRFGAVTVCIDVTSRAQKITETTEALRARDEVVNIVSHDLRNPLGAIRLSAQRLLRVAQTKPDTQELLPTIQNITRSAERMERLLADLLDAARIEAGRFSIAPAPFVLESTVIEAIELLRPLADAKQIVIDVEGVARISASILADRDRLLQVLSNLLGNAIKFTPDGGVVTLRAAERGDEIHISVSDTGPGVPPSVQPKIWDRFFTTQGERRLGTGLGLAIVKGIVEEHGGRVWLESTPGLGSTFHVALPRTALPRRSSYPA